MKNYSSEILRLLQEIPGVQVSYFYPSDFAKLPHVTYYELSNIEGDYDHITYQVDVWSKSPVLNQDIALQIHDKLHTVGFKRAFSGDLFETDSKIHHKTMRFEGYFHDLQNRFYKEV